MEKMENSENLVQPILVEKETKIPKTMLIVGTLIILAGLGTGFLLAKNRSIMVLPGGKAQILKTQKVVGSTDAKAYPDKAEGVLQKGGFEGEGTHKLIMNPKDPSQTAYLTSTLVNLDDFVGKKIRIWGQTFAGQKAAWLMDVGRVELLE